MEENKISNDALNRLLKYDSILKTNEYFNPHLEVSNQSLTIKKISEYTGININIVINDIREMFNSDFRFINIKNLSDDEMQNNEDSDEPVLNDETIIYADSKDNRLFLSLEKEENMALASFFDKTKQKLFNSEVVYKEGVTFRNYIYSQM